MTDKEQIMIDGVDILKEKINMCFILLLNKLETPETIEQTIYEHLDTFVRYWNAQLARKAQECESLNKRASSLEEIADDLQQRNHHLTQECEELNKKIRELSKAKLELSRILDCYKQAYFSCQRGRQIPAKYKFTIPVPLPPAEFVDTTRYRKALEEIEEVWEKDEDGDYDFVRWQILDIISKAKGIDND